MIKQRLEQNQKLNLSPQQIQFLGLLQTPITLLEKEVEKEIEENPALEEEEEEDLKDDRFLFANQSKSEGVTLQIEDQKSTLSEFLHQQLIGININDDLKFLIGYLINSLDDYGFLTQDLHSISNDLLINEDLNFSEKQIEKALHVLQKFEPYGVGAKNLQQCLIIQLRKYEKKHKLAIEVIKNHYTPFTNKNFEKIIKNTSITEAELKKIYKTIEELNPIPSNGFSKQQKTEEYITPDFIINLKNNIPILVLNKSHIKPIKVSKYYSDLLENTKDKNTKDFLKQKVEKAKWFSEALKNREKTLEKIMQKIIDVQSKYFKTGEEKDLIPMKLADIAEKVNMDISTISRFSNAKYVETHFGTFKLKEMFSEPYKKIDGQIISTKLIKSELKNIIENEDKKSPFTDEDLTDLLSKNEYYIARRTVAKYRDSLGIKIAKLRRVL